MNQNQQNQNNEDPNKIREYLDKAEQDLMQQLGMVNENESKLDEHKKDIIDHLGAVKDQKNQFENYMNQNQQNTPTQNNSQQNVNMNQSPKKGFNFRFNTWNIMLIGVIGVIVISSIISAVSSKIQELQQVDFQRISTELKNDNVKSIEYCENNLNVTLKNNSIVKTNITVNPANLLFNEQSTFKIDTNKISYKECTQGIPASDLISYAIMGLLLVGMGIIVWKLLKGMNDQGSKLFGFGESKAKISIGKKQDVTLADVAGIEEAKEELNEIVLFLKEPKRFRDMGARIPKGILMVGAPGTGKTLLARAIAGEAGVPFFATSGSEFEEMLVGAGASRVRDLFDKAKKLQPSLIFIDEIDAVGKKRGTNINSNATEQTLNQILVEMDGFEKNQNVIVIAATNRPDVLDPALLRPGRFDRKLTLDLPDQEGRTKILEIHAKNKPLATNVDLSKIAKRTIGFSGADLENVLNEAAIAAAKAGKKVIDNVDIEEATLKVVMGSARKRRRTQKELNIVAYHEAGHAVVSKFVPEADPVHKITIVSRGMSGGMTMHMPEDDETMTSRTKILSEIKVLLSGQIAEKNFMGDITTGASNDIERATKLARGMVKKFGMTKLGMINYGLDEEDSGTYFPTKDYSEAIASEIDIEVNKIIENCYAEAEKIILENRNKLENLKNALLEKEIINAEEFEEIMK